MVRCFSSSGGIVSCAAASGEHITALQVPSSIADSAKIRLCSYSLDAASKSPSKSSFAGYSSAVPAPYIMLISLERRWDSASLSAITSTGRSSGFCRSAPIM